MEEFDAQPEKRVLDSREIMPSVHWARLQDIPQTPGRIRRIYDFEIIYIYSGEMHVHFGDLPEPIVYRAGELLFVHPGVPHRIEVPFKSGSRMLGIHFDLYDDLEVISEVHMIVREDAVDGDMFCRIPVNGSGEFLFSRKYSSIPYDAVKSMEALCEEFAAARSGCEMACRGQMLLIVSSLLRQQPIPVSARLSAVHETLRELAVEWGTQIDAPWSNRDMARRLNVSEDHFIRLFKESYGMTPGQYVHHIRHQEAKRLLNETDLKVEMVGKRVGYGDLHHFSHIFKKLQGVSPRDYRKMCQIL